MDARPIRPNPDVVHQQLEGEIVLVHLRTNRIYSLNRSGGRVWELLGAGRDRAGILDQLQQEFAVAREELEREVDSLFERLSAQGLASREEP
ncbi:MAG TPA: PqqD family protein [Thermoleophilaceae bacterium]|nr:PqqD family protein [Thermoleophilaceae bacterium]